MTQSIVYKKNWCNTELLMSFLSLSLYSCPFALQLYTRAVTIINFYYYVMFLYWTHLKYSTRFHKHTLCVNLTRTNFNTVKGVLKFGTSIEHALMRWINTLCFFCDIQTRPPIIISLPFCIALHKSTLQHCTVLLYTPEPQPWLETQCKNWTAVFQASWTCNKYSLDCYSYM